jgi:hypothetical protein
MSKIRRSPGTKSRATRTPPSVDNQDSTAETCKVRGCCWRGKCPVHNAEYPRGFESTERLMRQARQSESGGGQ